MRWSQLFTLLLAWLKLKEEKKEKKEEKGENTLQARFEEIERMQSQGRDDAGGETGYRFDKGCGRGILLAH